MAVLLAPDSVEVYAPTAEKDAHGWAQDLAEVLVWSGMGSCQEALPGWNGAASAGGGAGPFDPEVRAACDLFLPTEVPVVPGHIAVAHNVRWLVQKVRQATDPTGLGGAACLVVSCVEAPVAPGGEDGYGS